ncbi:MAG TPA: hypothetical protein VK827_04670 [Lysobacter sp.]|nr:hypothetical protein [Lysobacter sp.]
MKPPPQSLDHARRTWLAGLAREHAALRTADSALALTRGHWMCGEYTAAIDGFVAACELAPDNPDARVALVRAASMTARDDLADAALADGLRRLCSMTGAATPVTNNTNCVLSRSSSSPAGWDGSCWLRLCSGAKWRCGSRHADSIAVPGACAPQWDRARCRDVARGSRRSAAAAAPAAQPG